jgi:MFS family permease
MKKSYWLLLLLICFSTGLMVPVLSLALLERGTSLPDLAVIFGFYSLTVFILEVPSGVLADLAGRKRVFILSNIFYLGASFLLLFADSLAMLIPVIILWGAGKAFASGSIDALLIDAYTETHGTGTMPIVTSRLALVETAGIAAGAFIGGFLPGMADSVFPSLGSYDLNIIMRCAFSAAVILLSAMFLHEPGIRTKQSVPLKQHISESVRFVRQSRIVLLLTLGMFFGGFFIFTVETYWQPAYTALLPGGAGWTLGLMSFGCFLFASLGNLLVKRIFFRKQRHLYIGYIAARLFLFAALALFSLQRSAIGFGAMFFLVYFLFGGANMAESTMLNIEIPTGKRASLLSFSSFVFQAGGLAAPLSALIATSTNGIRTLWGVVGFVFFIISAATGYILFVLHRNKRAAKEIISESAVLPNENT